MTSTIERLRYAVKTFKGIENKVLISVSDLDLLLALVDAVETLMTNWPQKRDGMDFETLPVGVKGTRYALAKLKEDESNAKT